MYHTVSQLITNPRRLQYVNDQYMQEVFNIKDDDLRFLKLFWQPDFDESWILLDEPFVETWIIKDTNLNLNYQKILFDMFQKDVDYKLSESTSMYMVKGHCLKNLCIICNKFFRDFFIKLARVAHILTITKSNNDNSIQIMLNKTSKQVEAVSQKTEYLTFLVEDIVSERVEEVAKAVVGNAKCEEVVNLIRLVHPFSATSRVPAHLRAAGYVVIRCLRKNYTKHLNRISSYDDDLMTEEVFSSPIANRGINLVKELKDMGVKTHKSNGVSSDNKLDLIEKIKTILNIEDMVM